MGKQIGLTTPTWTKRVRLWHRSRRNTAMVSVGEICSSWQAPPRCVSLARLSRRCASAASTTVTETRASHWVLRLCKLRNIRAKKTETANIHWATQLWAWCMSIQKVPWATQIRKAVSSTFVKLSESWDTVTSTLWHSLEAGTLLAKDMERAKEAQVTCRKMRTKKVICHGREL